MRRTPEPVMKKVGMEKTTTYEGGIPKVFTVKKEKKDIYKPQDSQG